MALKKAAVTVKVEFVVEAENKDALVDAVNSAKEVIAEGVKFPKRVKLDGAKVTLGEVTIK